MNMNNLSEDERYSIYCDFIAALTAVLLSLSVWLAIIIVDARKSPTLIDNPCAPGHQVIIDGVKSGCTNDDSNYRGRIH